MLGVTLFLGALGLHLPSALAVVVAGSLTAQGQMSWLWAGTVGVSGSALGALAGDSLGRVLSQDLLERWGGWIGLTAERRVRIDRLFERWGVLTVVLSRSLLSFLSPAVNVLAGAGRYSLRRFLPSAVVGRLIWTSAYLGLGYSLGVGIEAAADFLSSLSGFLISLTALAGLGGLVYRNRVLKATTAITTLAILVLGSMAPAASAGDDCRAVRASPSLRRRHPVAGDGRAPGRRTRTHCVVLRRASRSVSLAALLPRFVIPGPY